MASYTQTQRTTGGATYSAASWNVYNDAVNQLRNARTNRDLVASALQATSNALNQNHTHDYYDLINSYSGSAANRTTNGMRRI